MVEEPDTEERLQVILSALRQRGVKFAQYIPDSPGVLPGFLKQFDKTLEKNGLFTLLL